MNSSTCVTHLTNDTCSLKSRLSVDAIKYQYPVSNYIITCKLQSTNSVTLACLSPKKSHGLRTLSNRSISSEARQKAFWVLSVFHTRLLTTILLHIKRHDIRALASARGSVATRRAPRTKGTATRGPEGPESGQIMRVRGPEGPEDELS